MKRTSSVRRRPVSKASKGGVAIASTQSLTDQAEALAGGANYASAAPAMGQRPILGPLPPGTQPSAGSDERFQGPVRWQAPYGWNAYWTPRRNELTPFAVLRSFADTTDVVRLCIETRKDQLCSLDWDIGPKDKTAKKGSLQGKIARAKEFFRKPDKKRHFSTWLRAALEDILVVDALSIYKRRTYGGQLFGLQLIDGSTILPLLDTATGDTPDPPAAAYRQIIYGRPVEGGDCTTDDLFYLPRTVRTHTPYGLSPTEAVLLTINAWLNRQIFNLSYYTDGNIPEGLLEAPSGFTTKQLTEFQEYLDDYLTGDLSRRRRLKVVHPGGSKVFQFKTPDFSGTFDELLVKLVCAAFAVPPSEVGFTNDVNKSTSQGQENIVYRRGVKPIGGFMKDVFDDVLATDLDSPELQFVWGGGEAEDNLKAAQAMDLRIKRGVSSVDEERVDAGKEPIGLGPTIDVGANGPVSVEQFLKETQEALEAPAPDPNNPPPAPGAPANKPPEPGKKPPPPSDTTKIAKDLRTWRQVAIKDAKAGKPVRSFAAASIPVDLQALIERFLRVAGTDVAKVVAAFEFATVQYADIVKAGESRTLTAVEQRTAKAYRKVMASHFKAEGAALLKHLRDGLA